MLRSRMGQHFFQTTRGRILLHVRQSARTVAELVNLLGVTRNAVREHLAALERDGLVQRSGLRRGGEGKPAQVYALTPEAAELFRRAYAPVLLRVLDALTEQLPAASREALFDDVGRKLVADRFTSRDASRGASRGAVRERVAAAAALLGELGGLVEVRETDGGFAIHGSSCPLASVVGDHPELCRVPQAMLASIVGQPVQERCDRREPPGCYFVIGGGVAVAPQQGQ